MTTRDKRRLRLWLRTCRHHCAKQHSCIACQLIIARAQGKKIDVK